MCAFSGFLPSCSTVVFIQPFPGDDEKNGNVDDNAEKKYVCNVRIFMGNDDRWMKINTGFMLSD